MKNQIARFINRYTVMGAALIGLVGTPAIFAQEGSWDRHEDREDIHRDYNRVGRINSDIRRDQYRLRDDREDGRYYKAARDREDLERDYARRNNQLRDIRHDRRDLRHDRWGY